MVAIRQTSLLGCCVTAVQSYCLLFLWGRFFRDSSDSRRLVRFEVVRFRNPMGAEEYQGGQMETVTIWRHCEDAAFVRLCGSCCRHCLCGRIWSYNRVARSRSVNVSGRRPGRFTTDHCPALGSFHDSSIALSVLSATDGFAEKCLSGAQECSSGLRRKVQPLASPRRGLCYRSSDCGHLLSVAGDSGLSSTSLSWP